MLSRTVLEEKVYAGARRAFERLRVENPSSRLIGYSLFSDDSAMTICHIAGSTEALETAADPADFRYMPSEWDLEQGSDELDEVNQLINDPSAFQRNDDKEFVAFRDMVFASCGRALMRLVEEGFFGTEQERDSLLIMFSISDTSHNELVNEWAKMLNTEDSYQRYLTWFNSWS